jgi:amino acid transporter
MSGYDHLFKITVSYSEVTTFIVPFFSLNVVLIYRKKIPDFGKPPWEIKKKKKKKNTSCVPCCTLR